MLLCNLAPVILYGVLLPIIRPVCARPGELIAARRWHSSRPIVVLRQMGDRWLPVEVGPPEFSALAELEADGVIVRQPADASAPWPSRPLARHRAATPEVRRDWQSARLR